MEQSKYKILVVDDEELIRNLVVTVLSKLGYSYVTAVDGMDALEKVAKEKFDGVVTDIKMPKMDGIMLTREISNQYPGLPVMVITAFDEEYSAGIAISSGAREFVKKPFSLDEFAIRLHKMINDSKALSGLKSEKNIEKNVDEDIQDLVNELEETLKKN